MAVRSETKRGATFAFHIQAGVVEQSAINSQQSTILKRAIAVEPEQPCYRLLIVDDKADNRQLLVKLLTPFGFELREAKHGQEAIDIWESWKPHLILMDLRMPVLDGYKATRRIKSSPGGKHTIVIIMSASVVEEGRLSEIAAGYDGFLQKPFQEHEVFELLHKYLGLRFVYEDDLQAAAGRSPGAREEELTPEALAALPDELRRNLERAATISNMNRIMELIEDIRVHDSAVADALSALANDFAYSKILSALRRP